MRNAATFILASGLVLASAMTWGAINSVHVTVTLPAGEPSVTASFELTKVSRSGTVCPFLSLSGASSASEQSAWQAGLAITQGLTLTRTTPVETSEGLRQDELDSQNRVRRSTWTWDNGMVHQIALFDTTGQVLQLDRWRNQRWVPDDMAAPLICGKNVTRALAIRLRGAAANGGQPQVQALEDLADRTSNYCLIKDLGLSNDACNPVGLQASQYVPAPVGTMAISNGAGGIMRAAADDPSDLKEGPLLGKPLVIAPNPASGEVEAAYQLDTEALVLLNILDLTGKTMAVYSLGDQGSGSHTTSFTVSHFAPGIYFATLISNNGGGHKLLSVFKFAVKR